MHSPLTGRALLAPFIVFHSSYIYIYIYISIISIFLNIYIQFHPPSYYTPSISQNELVQYSHSFFWVFQNMGGRDFIIACSTSFPRWTAGSLSRCGPRWVGRPSRGVGLDGETPGFSCQNGVEWWGIGSPHFWSLLHGWTCIVEGNFLHQSFNPEANGVAFAKYWCQASRSVGR